MKTLRPLFECLTTLLLACLPIQAMAAASLPAAAIQSLREAGIPVSSVSVLVQQVDKSRPLLALNPARPMNPASTMKLLTTYAALELLGPAYTWKTEAYATGELKDGVLQGDLILRGQGDPGLTLERFQTLLREVRSTGLREIRGDLVLDHTWFETGGDPGAFDDEPYRAYNVLPDALLVNFKATQFTFRGNATTGKVLIDTSPALAGLRIVNNVELRQVPCADWKDRIGFTVQPANNAITVTFSGNYSLTCDEKSLELSVLDSVSYTDALFRQLWQELGGTLHGKTRYDLTPPTARHLATANSLPLGDQIRLINKFSNNVMARQTLFTLGAEKQGAPGNAEKGIRSVREWIATKKLDFPELSLENGAGLSRQERISAQHLSDLLFAAWRSPVMPELMSSLPVAAVDGTLQKRLQASDVAGKAHMKTGSIDGVRAIAGYLLDKQGRRWVVVFIVNHPNAQASREAQDILLKWLYVRD